MTWPKNPPIICIVGHSKVGKTTLLEKLISELKQRGYRIATIKHHSHLGLEIDRPSKDTWRHTQAGSDHVVIVAPDKVASIRRVDREPTLEEIAATINDVNDVDVILAEGYKRTGRLKIEVVRAAQNTEPVCTSNELLALVTDVAMPYDVPQFGLDDAVGLADLIETLM